MNRRTLIALFGGASLALPLQVRAQQPGRTYRIGGLQSSPREAPQNITLLDELRRLGFIEGQNLIIDPHGFGLRSEQFLQAAVELVNAQVDVILAGGNPAIRAAQQATTTLPILGVTDDMVGSGLAASLAHPGANTTGISLLATEPTVNGRMLTELIPAARHIAALTDPNTTAPGQLQALQEAARTRRRPRHPHGSHTRRIKPAIDAAKASGAAGLTSWHRQFSSSIAGSFSSGPLHCDCLQYINGRRWLGKVDSPGMARASSSSSGT